MKRIESGLYINFDHISEIAVIPWYDTDHGEIFLIWYWILGEKTEEGSQIPGWYKTKEEAWIALDKIMGE